MNKAEAERLYNRASELASRGRHNEALPILDELLRAFPNEPRLLYARAVCLARLGKLDDSLRLCERLISAHNHDGARELMERLTSFQDPPKASTSQESVSELESTKTLGEILRSVIRAIRYNNAIRILQKSPYNSIRIGAAKSLAAIGDVRAVTPLYAVFHRAFDTDLGVAAAQAMMRLGDDRPFNDYVEMLRNGGVCPAVALGQIGDRRAIEPLIETLGVANSELRKQAARALARLGEPWWEGIVTGQIDDFELLGSCGDPRALKVLVSALKSNDVEFCRTIVEALRKSGDARAVQPLIDVLKTDRSQLRQLAVYALGDLGDVRALDALSEAFRDKNEYVALAAMRVSKRLGGLRAVQPLMGALGHENAEVRMEAMEALEQIDGYGSWAIVKGDEGDFARLSARSDDSRTLESFVTALQNKKLNVRRTAALALIRIATAHPECVARVSGFREVIARPHEDKVTYTRSSDCGVHSDQGIGMSLPF